jgi:predicted NAD/FAD-binding protein
VSVSYWLQELQPIPFKQPLFVSLNPLAAPAPASILGRFDFAHPVFDLEALSAQEALPTIQGKNGVWFAGAWAGYGFHEDGLRAGQEAADAILAQLSRQDQQARGAGEANESDRAHQVPEALVA